MVCSRLNTVCGLFHKGGSRWQQSDPLSHEEEQRCTGYPLCPNESLLQLRDLLCCKFATSEKFRMS